MFDEWKMNENYLIDWDKRDIAGSIRVWEKDILMFIQSSLVLSMRWNKSLITRLLCCVLIELDRKKAWF